MTVIVPRVEWGAKAATSVKRISVPTRELWLHHSAGNERGAAGMRQMQADHMTARRGKAAWSDVAYSFVVDAHDLTVFEGRGPGFAGAHTEGRNSISHGICVMGNFEHVEPSDALVVLLAGLVAHGHRAGWWPDQLSGGHRDVKATACPGVRLYHRIVDINARAAVLLGKEPPVSTTTATTITTRLQQALNQLGYGLAVDGDPGPRTLGAALHAIPALDTERNQLKAAIAAQLRTIEEERQAHAAVRERLAELETAIEVAPVDEVRRKAALLDRIAPVVLAAHSILHEGER